MKKTIKSLILALSFFMSHWALYGQGDNIVYLDIPGLDGEYTLPSVGNRPNVPGLPRPKNNNIRIQSFTLAKTQEINIGSASGGAGAGKAKGYEMELKFRVEKSIVELSKKLFNHIITPAMTLIIDSPGFNSEPQRERMRIKVTNVYIKSIDQSLDGENIPFYTVKILFFANRTATIIYDAAHPNGEISDYCWDYSQNTNCESTIPF